VTLESLRQRRTSARRPLHASVDVLEPCEGAGVTINASDGGLRVAVDCKMEPGDIALFYVHEAGKVERLERAHVVWSREVRDGYIVGLRITGLH
jgi:hypothetical protein